MDSSTITCISMVLSLLGVMLGVTPVGEAQLVYNVGAIGGAQKNWAPQQDLWFYQRWADRLTLSINDTLFFTYDATVHDVTQVWLFEDLNNCNVSSLASYIDGGASLVYMVAAGTYYFTSSGLSTDISVDCQQGMAFSITVFAEDSPPPPLSPSGQRAPGPGPDPDPALGSAPGEDSGTPRQVFSLQIPWAPQTNANFYKDLLKGFPFHNGSVLVFDYVKDQHNVVQVNESDFNRCQVPSRPLAKYNDPNRGVPLAKGVNYFIDGIGNNCAVNNMKLSVEVGNSRGGKNFPVAAAVVPAVVVSIAAVIAVTGFLYCRRQHGSESTGEDQERPFALRIVGLGRSDQASAAINSILKGNATRLAASTIFSYAELERATTGFSADHQVGSGGFGTVYRGKLDNGQIVAIKMAKHANDVDSFVNEVDILSQVNNRNLVKLLGCCIEATPPIFHRDVKSANILLDHNFNAKVADFGLSKLVDLEATHVSTGVKGTPGYLDPEYFHNFQLTDKTDVYSFGVVLLELITSKKPIDLSKPDAEQNLALSSMPLIKSGRVREIIDTHISSSLAGDDLQSVEAVAQVAVACLVSSRALRPSMSEGVEMLQGIKGSKLRAEEFYQRADVTDSESTLLDTQAHGMVLGESGSTSTTRATSSSYTGSSTELVRPR